jgi:aspartyl/glutamyl-tRNA(Asn/Gln) amidotransferase C subunit
MIILITKEELLRLCAISRINLDQEQRECFQKNIDKTVAYIDSLQDLELDDVDFDLLEVSYSKLRNDECHKFGGDILSKNRLTKNGYLKGPKMG